MASSSSSSSSTRSWKYDVFLSFRGSDTRNTFVGHLYSAFQQHGILTYKDDVTLDRGDTIGPSLMKAIEESQILLIIFSENYADSSWCLDELSHIMKCRDSETGQIVMPIFYHVDPSDVRKQKRKYGEAFAKHGLSENNKNKVESWKKALVDASNIVGWETKHVANRHEAKCVEEIVDSILDKLQSLNSAVEDEDLVGMGTRLKYLKQLLRIGSSGGMRMVGIWGIGGGGKTTLATFVYLELKISGQFHGCCFVANVREESKRQNGLRSLQEKILSSVFNKEMNVESVDIGKHTIKDMLCRRNVLIVLDDVDNLEQLEALAGRHHWFGDGSRIIITTRNEQLLIAHGVDEVYRVSLLSNDEAIRLFRRYAYHKNNPVEDYDELSSRVIHYVKGLPLALKILGSYLCGRNKDGWLSTLARLEDHPNMDILQKLKISYDGLTHVEKELFLDIACFHRWESKDKAMKILDACGFYPVIGIKVLIEKALITVTSDGTFDPMFDMHDLVQEMAHYIVRGEHPNNPEKHSRVWRKEDIEDMCSTNATKENDKIEALQCVVSGLSSNFIMLVSNMNKLRFLKVRTPSFAEGPSFLSNELRYLSWPDFPASPFPESFEPKKLVALKVERSLQKELWKSYKYLPSLKDMELSDMQFLVRTSDFGGLPCLQKLTLSKCYSLEEIHPSLGNHNSLVHVSVSNCNKLKRFPTIFKMDKMENLEISWCKGLVEFPKIEANMDSLVTLSLNDVGIEVLPSTIGECCTNLISLKLGYCSKLRSMEGNFHAVKGLQNFLLYSCKQFEKLPKDIFNENLHGLGLRKLGLSQCGWKDGEIPTEIGELSSLRELDLSWNDFTRLDFSLSRLTRLKLLNLGNCVNLVELPELPSSLAILKAINCKSLKVIKDDAHRRCKWLCEVSICGGRKNISGLERLLETMFQGNAVKSGCMILQLNASEILRVFEPRLVRGERCIMKLPENWYIHFSGFLLCATISHGRIFIFPRISMKHVEKSEGGFWMGKMGDSQHDDDGDVFCKEQEETTVDDGDGFSWTYFLSFSLLRNTSWWDPTSTAVEVEFDNSFIYSAIRKCGWKLVPKGGAAAAECSSSRSETTPTTHSSSSSSSSSDDDAKYKCKLDILHDSKSAFNFELYQTRGY